VTAGLMQDDHPLTIQHLLDRMRRCYGDGEVVTALGNGNVRRASYAEVVARADALRAGLQSLGVEPGTTVGSLAWNTQEHLEIYLAVPSMGAVLHTINLRLSEEQLLYTIDHAHDEVILVDASLVHLLESISDRLAKVRQYVLIGEGSAPALTPCVSYEELLAAAGDTTPALPQLDDQSTASICYTSGTTGDPKGVAYSHRSTMLHSLSLCTVDGMGIRNADRLLPIVPMFHVNAWGIPFAAALVGADLVLPSRFVRPDVICDLIVDERVTFSAAIPTVWWDVLRLADELRPDLSSLRMIGCGGAAVPLALMQAFEERHGVPIIQMWGMTETGPLAAAAHPPKNFDAEASWRFRDRAGRILPFLDVRIVDDNDNEQPWDGESVGEIEIRGPWIARQYLDDDAPEKFHDGWLRTGDIGTMDERGYMRITDRAKDVIKSGGEWVSSLDVEAAIASHPAVREVAVIAMPHERWTERPLACIVLEPGSALTAEELRDHAEPQIARWWVPDAWAFVDEVPKTSTGKFDKKLLRARLANDELEIVGAERAARPHVVGANRPVDDLPAVGADLLK
jgi:fatty-acyl-CoA synthase